MFESIVVLVRSSLPSVPCSRIVVGKHVAELSQAGGRTKSYLDSIPQPPQPEAREAKSWAKMPRIQDSVLECLSSAYLNPLTAPWSKLDSLSRSLAAALGHLLPDKELGPLVNLCCRLMVLSKPYMDMNIIVPLVFV